MSIERLSGGSRGQCLQCVVLPHETGLNVISLFRFRFQVMTKTPDQAIAKAYLAVQNIDDSISLSSAGNVLFDAYENDNQAESVDKTPAEKSKTRAHVSVEGRAVDRYYSDEEWAGRMARETREEEERRSKRSGFGLKGLLGGKQDKGKGTNVKKGNYIQGAPWIESR
jgi:hypothetical protein